jgi:predicted O-linked N-acetylglucosamine transferase (SPINDLY family)
MVSNLVGLLNYTTNHTSAECLSEAQRYGAMVAQKVTARFTTWQCEPMPPRLRIGIVSADLVSHPVGWFLESILAQLDQSRIELIAYSNNPREDDLTTRIKPYFSAWKSLCTLNDQDAAQLIHQDAVHVLLDLSGHTGKNRLPVFAWKPAPVQVTWLGYFATTGVAEMDYLLADKTGVPEAQHINFSEAIWYLPDTRLCFTPPHTNLPVASLPSLTHDFVTFGCFQNLAKISDEVLIAWGRILAALPNARLRLACKQLGDVTVAARLTERLRQQGIAPARVTMHGSVSRAAYLAAYAEVDMLLDTFPFPGGTTTCEALWMGVPTLTLAGDTLLSRQGASLLTAAGLLDWIAMSEADYVAKAVHFASDLPKLATLREELREQVRASPLFDAPRFAKHFEQALWGMWQTKMRDLPAEHSSDASR